mmetsp:Transcript_8017/g.22045  ORF Transcript_8017/g.22045 Transcript_8017/m.22045 type:complete len:249 (-) Transcript_8017:351-1097(-)
MWLWVAPSLSQGLVRLEAVASRLNVLMHVTVGVWPHLAVGNLEHVHPVGRQALGERLARWRMLRDVFDGGDDGALREGRRACLQEVAHGIDCTRCCLQFALLGNGDGHDAAHREAFELPVVALRRVHLRGVREEVRDGRDEVYVDDGALAVVGVGEVEDTLQAPEDHICQRVVRTALHHPLEARDHISVQRYFNANVKAHEIAQGAQGGLERLHLLHVQRFDQGSDHCVLRQHCAAVTGGADGPESTC